MANNDYLVEGSTFQIDDSEVVLYSDKVRATELLNILHDVNAEHHVDAGYSTVSVFDSSWINKTNDAVATNTVLNSINDHAPTIVLDGGYFTESKIINKVSASSPTEQIHCAYMDDNGVTYEYSIGGGYSESEALELAYEWATNIPNQAGQESEYDGDKNVGKAYIAEPGVMLSVDKEIDSSYVSYTYMENYNIHTCHHEEKLFGLINDNTDYYVHWLPYYVTVYNGYSEGNYATWS